MERGEEKHATRRAGEDATLSGDDKQRIETGEATESGEVHDDDDDEL